MERGSHSPGGVSWALGGLRQSYVDWGQAALSKGRVSRTSPALPGEQKEHPRLGQYLPGPLHRGSLGQGKLQEFPLLASNLLASKFQFP